MNNKLSLALILISASVLTSCNNAVNSPTAGVDSVETVQLTPLEVELSDSDRLLDIRIWKFDVSIPPDHNDFKYTFELRRKGENPQILSGLEFLNFHPMKNPLIVGFVPIEHEWARSEKFKMSFQVPGSVGGFNTVDNPFVGCGVGSAAGERNPDGSYRLMFGDKPARSGEKPSPGHDIELVLKVESSVFKLKSERETEN